MSEIDYEWSDEKYRVTFYKNGQLKAYRYGEEWQDLTGNNLILAMLQSLVPQNPTQTPEEIAKRIAGKDCKCDRVEDGLCAHCKTRAVAIEAINLFRASRPAPSERKSAEEIYNSALERAAEIIEGHRCDVSCGDPFMGKVLASAIRAERREL